MPPGFAPRRNSMGEPVGNHPRFRGAPDLRDRMVTRNPAWANARYTPSGIQRRPKPPVSVGSGQHRASTDSHELHDLRVGEQRRVVDLGLVAENVAVRVRGDRREPLPDELPDPRPRHPRRWSRLIRRWRRSCGENAGTPAARHAFAIDVRSASAPEPANRRRVGVAVLARAELALELVGEHRGKSTHSALRVFVVAARSRTRRRGSS